MILTTVSDRRSTDVAYEVLTLVRADEHEGSTLMAGKGLFRPMEARFWDRVVRGEGVDGCWLWSGHVRDHNRGSRSRYGAIAVGGGEARSVYVHRYSWELHRGAVPVGFTVSHTCSSSLCVNPEHLVLRLRDSRGVREAYVHGGLERRKVRGRVKKFTRAPELRFWPQVDQGKPGECWLWKGSLANRRLKENATYGVFSADALGGTMHAHRAAWILTHGPIPDGLLIRHKCNRPLCVNPRHLCLGTQADNTGDMVAADRQYKKYTDRVIREVRRLRARGVGRSEVARRFGMHPVYVSEITGRKVRKHVA